MILDTPETVKSGTVDDYLQSKFLSEIKNKMLSGDSNIADCSLCYKSEQATGVSMRTAALTDYKLFSEKHYEKIMKHYGYLEASYPKIFELHVGNLCNLKCLTCRPEDSSSFLSENKILKISNHSQKDFNISEDIVRKIVDDCVKNKVEVLDLRGGESMMSPLVKNILLSYDKETVKGITLRVQTNGTILDDDWREIFDKFSSIEIMVSIDAYGDDNHYIRYPAKWNDINQNIQYFQTIENIKIYINCTVSNLNFLVLPKLLQWADDNKIFVKLFQLATPQEFQITNMPANLFEQAIKNLKPWENNISVAAIMKNKHSYDAELWHRFCKTISLRDKHRGNSIFDIIPEYKVHWNE